MERFSQKELDRYQGEVKDLYEEQQFLKAEMSLDEKIDALYTFTENALLMFMQRLGLVGKRLIDFDPCLVVNVEHKQAAEYVVRYFKIKLVASFTLPRKEIFIANHRDVDRLIRSRVEKQVMREGSDLVFPDSVRKRNKIKVEVDDGKNRSETD